MKITTKLSITFMGILLIAFLIFLLNMVPIKETCICINNTCSVEEIYLSEKITRNYLKDENAAFIKTSTYHNYSKSTNPLFRIVSVYKLEPIFNSVYLLKFRAKQDLRKITNNKEASIVKYNVVILMPLFFIITCFIILGTMELFELKRRIKRM